MQQRVSEIVKAGIWLGEIFSKPMLKKRKAWPLEVRVDNISSSIAPWKGVTSDVWKGYINLKFHVIPKHVPVYIQSVQLRYSGSWFDGERLSEITETGQSNEHVLIGTHIAVKSVTPDYFYLFELDIPNNATTLNVEASLLIVSEDLPCEAQLGNLTLKRIY